MAGHCETEVALINIARDLEAVTFVSLPSDSSDDEFCLNGNKVFYHGYSTSTE